MHGTSIKLTHSLHLIKVFRKSVKLNFKIVRQKTNIFFTILKIKEKKTREIFRTKLLSTMYMYLFGFIIILI